MKAFIHAFQGKPWNEDCETAYNGFKRLGVESVLFSCNEELDQRNPEDIVVGGMLIMGSVFDQLGIVPNSYDYPEELTDYLGRKINTIRLKDLQKQELSVFIKPVEEKAAKGTVVNTLDDAEESGRKDWTSAVYNWCDSLCFSRIGKSDLEAGACPERQRPPDLGGTAALCHAGRLPPDDYRDNSI